MFHYCNLVEGKGIVLELSLVRNGLDDVMSFDVVLPFVYYADDIVDILVRGGGEESQPSCVYAQDGNLLASYAAGCAQQCSVAAETYGNVGRKTVVLNQFLGLGNHETLALKELVEWLVYGEGVAMTDDCIEQLLNAS